MNESSNGYQLALALASASSFAFFFASLISLNCSILAKASGEPLTSLPLCGTGVGSIAGKMRVVFLLSCLPSFMLELIMKKKTKLAHDAQNLNNFVSNISAPPLHTLI